MLTIQLLNEIKNLFGITIAITKFIGSPTVTSLSNQLDGKGNDTIRIDKIKRYIKYDLSLLNSLHVLKLPNKHMMAPKTVLVTGATGFLGMYLVQKLIQDYQVRIYCLIKSNDETHAKSKLQQSFSHLDNDDLIGNQNVIAIPGDLSKPWLGLTKLVYNKLANECDAVYHCGALVHHMYDYLRLRTTNVFSTIELLKFATISKNKAVHYISTIGIDDLKITERLEQGAEQWSYPELSGYLSTKWVSEQLIMTARKAGVAAYIYRPGNITGDSVSGYCNPYNNRRLLRLKGYLALGKAFVADNDRIEMMPVDRVAKFIIDNSFKPVADQYIFDLRNPNVLSMGEYLVKIISLGYTLEIIDDPKIWEEIISNMKTNNALYQLGENIREYNNKTIARKTPHNMRVASEVPGYDILISQQIAYLIKIGFLRQPD